MALKTPSQLDTLSQHNETLDQQTIFIVQQGKVVGKITLAEIAEYILGSIENFISTAVSNAASDSQDRIAFLTSQLQLKANINHTHTAASVGLGNVQNIAPEDMPISTAMQTALDQKVDSGDLTITSLTIAGPGPQW